jgi:hypothetical protein
MTPTSSPTPASSIRATASRTVWTIDHCSPSKRLYGSSAMRRPTLRASAAIARRPSTIVARSPRPVSSTTALGRNGARRRRLAQYASTRSAGSCGPASGHGPMDATSGTAFVDSSPLASKAPSAPSPSLSSQMPTPVAPASR